MTQPPATGPTPEEYVTAAQQAGAQVPYGQAAEQAVRASQADPVPSSVPQPGPVAAEPLPAEAEHDALMAEFRRLSEQMATMQEQFGGKVAQLEAQLAQAKAGAAVADAPALIKLYADAVAAKVASHRDLNPDLPPGHFDAAVRASAELSQAAADPAGNAGRIGELADALERFLTRTHQRLSGKPLDFSAALYDLEMVTAELAKLGAAGQ